MRSHEIEREKTKITRDAWHASRLHVPTSLLQLRSDSKVLSLDEWSSLEVLARVYQESESASPQMK